MSEDDSTGIQDVRGLTAQRKTEEPYFIVLAGGPVGMMHRLRANQEMVIGRSVDADVRVEDDGVSRRHAKVVMTPENQPMIVDLDSTNGTFVNGFKVKQHLLQDGDKIQIGSTSILKFSYQDDLERSFQEELYDRGVRDGLTGLYNKRYFLDRLAAEFSHAQRHKQPLTLLIFDIDHFKRVNDTNGHPAGDYVISEIAKAVGGALRAEDVFARYGGEEFIILMRDVDDNGALVLAERVRRTVESHSFVFEGKPIPITISVGIASLAGTTTFAMATEMVHRADQYLYKAKNAGRNRVEGLALEAH